MTIFELEAVRRSNTTGHLHRMKRPRRVRISYPAALVELALVLCATVGKREAASAIGVGISTVYRWVGMHRTAWMPRGSLRTDLPAADTAAIISELSIRCRYAGFQVDSSLLNRQATAPESQLVAGPNERKDAAPILAVEVVVSTGVLATEPMSRIKQEIETKYAMPLSCQKLAAMANMPRIQFIRQFSATFGVPPYQYLLGVRVKRAMELLQYSRESLPVVAATTGFGSASSMHRAFKRFAGGSPGNIVKAIAPRRDVAFTNSANARVPYANTL